MKKFTILSLAIGILFSVSTFAQSIPNGDFEEWEDGLYGYEMPVNWFSIGSLIGSQDITKVTPGQSGDFAARIKPVDFPGFGITAPILMSTPFHVTQKYGQFTGYIEGTSVGVDTLFILAMMQSGNDIIGVGGGFAYGVVDPFTKFEIDILYEGTAVPDSCMISFILGHSDLTANIGSEYKIDNLSLSGLAAIDDIESSFSMIGNPYPNPSTSVVNMPFELKEPSDLTLNVYDMQGRLIYSQADKSFDSGSNEISIDVSNYGSGNYFLTLSTGLNSIETKSFIVK